MITWEGGEEPLRLMLKEGMRHKWRLVFGFVVICTAGVLLGLAWPKTYASSVTVALDQENVIDALMEGRAVRTEVDGPPANASEMGLGRSVLERALEYSGQIDEDTSAEERAQLINDLGERTNITQAGAGLVAIHYRGPGPDAAQEMTQRLGELFIEETLQGREQESAAAFRFIDRQAQQYDQKLKETEREIEQLRAEHPVAQPGAAEQLNRRETELRQQIGELEQQIREENIREESLQDRLAQLPRWSPGAEGGAQGPSRLAQLRNELETLRLRYHESYPDIVALKRQIQELEQRQSGQGNSQVAQGGDGSGGQTGGGQAGSAQQPNTALTLGGGELRQSVQESLYESRTNVETLQSRLESVRTALASVHEDQAALEEVQNQINALQRDYQINQNIYEDLLARRENARVSRDLGSADQGLTMRIEEPARTPTEPENPQPLHFALAGGVLGAGVPIGLLFLVVMLDPRIRDVAHVPVETGSVLLTTIPHARNRVERRLAPLSIFACVLVVIATVVGLAALMWVQSGYGI